MDIITLNNRIEDFVNKHGLVEDAMALQKEYAIVKSDEWLNILDEFEK